MKKSRRLLIALLAVIFFITGTTVAIRFAKGYRFSLKNKALQGTGLLLANSTPEGASVFINDKLTTATDDTLNLTPGEYRLKIAKDGYIPWEKTIMVEAELVTQTLARLFPAVPNLNPLTFSGALNPAPSPDGQFIAFAVNTATTDDKNGLYILNLSSPALSFTSNVKQISRSTAKFDYSKAQLTWAPNSNQILASFNLGQTDQANLLLNTTGFNDLKDIKDVTATLPILISEWNNILDLNEQPRYKELPEAMLNILNTSAQHIYWSQEQDKILYTATASATIPDELIPPLPSSSTQTETRTLEPDNLYVYDLEEDKNFKLSTLPLPEPKKDPTNLDLLNYRYWPLYAHHTQWYPDSRHLVTVFEDKIIIMEYDNTNQQTVYAGPFAQSFAYPAANNSLIILASLNGGSNLPPNLYSINLK